MTTVPASSHLEAPARAASRGMALLSVAAVSAIIVSLVARFFIGLNDSLWLDETWTGVFATEPSLASLTRQVLHDVNAPAHAYVIWFWAKLFGVSNLALRVPSVLFALAAPAVAWFGLRRDRPRLALTWCALLAVWTPGIELSGYARCYPLLYLAATVSAVAFLRALERPTLVRTALWIGAASFAVMTHYHAALLAAAQFAVFAVVHRRRLLSVSPAALVATPAFAWIAVHAPLLLAYARPDTAWYDRLTLAELPATALFLVGAPAASTVIALSLLIALLLGRTAKTPTPAIDRMILLTGSASLLGAAACLIFGMLSPSFTIRYLTPFVPGALLVVAGAVLHLARGRSEAPAALLIGFAALAMLWIGQAGRGGDRLYSFEKASAWLAEAKPARLVFLFDHPATNVAAPSQLDRVGGFFLRRSGHAVRVTPLASRPGVDMNLAMLAAAGPDAGLLWLYDTGVHGTSAIARPPRIAALDPRYVCRDFGRGSIGVLACRQRAR